jgi:tRNA dimethylallyltransferase
MICKSIVLLTGPTGCGKTELAINLALELRSAEILSVDSRQFYRYMDIGTAKPSTEDMVRTKHHFIDIAYPSEQISAGEYGRRARAVISSLWLRGITPILVGGSGMYWQAVIDGFYEDENDYSVARKKLKIKLEEEGIDAVYRQLGELDPIGQFRIEKNDTKRVLRAFEVALQSGGTLGGKWRENRPKIWNCTPLMIWLDRDRDNLYRRIDQRVDSMMANGLLAEVEGLKEMGYDTETYTMGSMGYQELLMYFEGQYSLGQAIEEIKKNSRRFAKRQTTWFRKDRRLRRLDVDKWGFLGCKERILLQFQDIKGSCFYS